MTPVTVTNPRFPDLVPRELREQWKAAGHYPGIAIFDRGLARRTIVARPRFDIDGSLGAIERDRPTHLFGVPTMLHRIMTVLEEAPSPVVNGSRWARSSSCSKR